MANNGSLLIADRGLPSLDTIGDLTALADRGGHRLEFNVAVPARRYSDLVETFRTLAFDADGLADALREKQDNLGPFMDTVRDAILADMDFPREHWTRIASTNPPERVNREIKRRTDVVGFVGKTAIHAIFLSSSLADDDAIIRLVGAIMPETNDE